MEHGPLPARVRFPSLSSPSLPARQKRRGGWWGAVGCLFSTLLQCACVPPSLTPAAGWSHSPSLFLCIYLSRSLFSQNRAPGEVCIRVYVCVCVCGTELPSSFLEHKTHPACVPVCGFPRRFSERWWLALWPFAALQRVKNFANPFSHPKIKRCIQFTIWHFPDQACSSANNVPVACIIPFCVSSWYCRESASSAHIVGGRQIPLHRRKWHAFQQHKHILTRAREAPACSVCLAAAVCGRRVQSVTNSYVYADDTDIISVSIRKRPIAKGRALVEMYVVFSRINKTLCPS